MIVASWGTLGGPLGALLGLLSGPLGPSWSHFDVLEIVGLSWGHIGRFLEPSWPVSGRSCLWKSHAGTPKSARERAGTPGKFEILGPQPLEY